MKRVLILLLSAVLMTAALTGCSSVFCILFSLVQLYPLPPPHSYTDRNISIYPFSPDGKIKFSDNLPAL